MSRFAAVLAVAVLAGCVTDYVHLSGRDLHGVAPDVGRGGHLHTFANGDEIDVGPDTVVDATDAAGKHVALRFADLYAGCDSRASSAPCPLDTYEQVALPYHHVSHGVKSVGETVFAVGIVGGLIGCAFECGSPYNYVSGGVIVLGAVGTLVIFYALVKVVSHMD